MIHNIKIIAATGLLLLYCGISCSKGPQGASGADKPEAIANVTAPQSERSVSYPKTIHVFVALCDNVNQGIVPVPAQLGNGEDPANNLYWGAMYGVKTFFSRSIEWETVASASDKTGIILERCVFRHKATGAYLIADAYKGTEIKRCITDLLNSCAGAVKGEAMVQDNGRDIALPVGGGAQLLAYVGHNGLMDFTLENYPQKQDGVAHDAVVLCCRSREYFSNALVSAGSKPVLLTTGLMAPEAYVLKSVLDGWLAGEGGDKIAGRAAQAYAQYQKCSITAAERLFAAASSE
ncbi:MAG: hypothetical protein HZA48_00725 [Planctomycetes bacterium]|nr:hypothetical protein [Planctomycetota bacterium]